MDNFGSLPVTRLIWASSIGATVADLVATGV